VRWLVVAAGCLLVLPAVAQGVVSGPARVVDGDTVVVGGVTVRLKGVDAVERGAAGWRVARQAAPSCSSAPSSWRERSKL
jgi:endonuclease YncB( thermonuclease family)